MRRSTPSPEETATDRPGDEREDLRGSRLLVVCHDFPPVRSPQAIRALAFARRLAPRVAELHVLTRTRLPGGTEPTLPANVVLHRCPPGRFEALLDRLAARRLPAAAGPADAAVAAVPAVRPPRLNWKGRLVALARRAHDLLRFPDGRAAWAAPARRRLRALCGQSPPDLALVMHEPAASLLLADELTRRGIPWLADLADPVLAPYTPRHWRGRAARLETRVIAGAGAVTVTNPATAALLARRHGRRAEAFTVIPQGFETRPAPPPPPRDGPLRLLYTGRFYRFRDPSALLRAVLDTPGVVLEIAGPEMPGAVLEAAARHPDRIRLHGELEHAAALALQPGADVLASVGNAGTEQAPGKVQEYFGAGRPVLHVFHDPADPAPSLLAETGRGLACPAEPVAIAACLRQLQALKASGALATHFTLDPARVAALEWDALVARLAAVLAGLRRA